MSPTISAWFRASAALVVVTVASITASAADDTLILKDGRTFTGHILSEDATVIVFETRLRGMSLTTRYRKADVGSVTREAAEGPTYYALPIVGPIGRVSASGTFVSADAFKSALAEVRQARPSFVVLVIDSDGGDVGEMGRIVQAIEESRDMRFIAFVKHGISAAAIIALACPKIYMAAGATIGAAVPWQVGPNGTPQNIEEKFQSVLRAEFRHIAALGGHSTLLVRAMMETELELVVANHGGKPVVVEAGPGATGTTVKRRGQILTLTADEALACGLSAGTVDSIDTIAPHLGLSGWRPADDRAWYTMVNAAGAVQWRDEQKRMHAAKVDAWLATVEDIRKETDRVEQQLSQARIRRAAAEGSAFELASQQDAELAAARMDWELARRDHPANSLIDSSANIEARRRVSDADAAYGLRTSLIHKRWEPLVSAARAKAEAAEQEADKLQRQLARLRAQIPTPPKP